MDLKFFWPKFFFGPKIFFRLKILGTQNFHLVQHFFWPKIVFGLKYFWIQNLSGLKKFLTQSYFVPNIFWTNNHFGPKLFWSIIFMIILGNSMDFDIKGTKSCFKINSDIGSGPFLWPFSMQYVGVRRGRGRQVGGRVKKYFVQLGFIRL